AGPRQPPAASATTTKQVSIGPAAAVRTMLRDMPPQTRDLTALFPGVAFTTCLLAARSRTARRQPPGFPRFAPPSADRTVAGIVAVASGGGLDGVSYAAMDRARVCGAALGHIGRVQGQRGVGGHTVRSVDHRRLEAVAGPARPAGPAADRRRSA